MVEYRARDRSQLTPVALMLATDGIAQVAPIYTTDIMQRLNAVMDPLFDAQSSKARAYVTSEDMARYDLLGTVLGGEMRNLLLSIVPDPVLYHCHAYEIAANSPRPHIFGERLAGWHRDGDSEHFKNDVTHASIFVYMTNVGARDGAFEFSPVEPTKWVRSNNPSITVTGTAGYSFAWNRNFYHRASANTGTVRRRLIKLSIQPNSFKSAHLSNPNFQAARRIVPAGDPYLDLLLGRYQGMPAPVLPPPTAMRPIPLHPTGTINIADHELTKFQLGEKAREARTWLKRQIFKRDTVQSAAYD